MLNFETKTFFFLLILDKILIIEECVSEMLFQVAHNQKTFPIF